MPKRVKYCFGPFTFSSQLGVKQYASYMRERYANGVTISNVADVAFLTDLISCHVNRDIKVGCGISRFYVDNAPDHTSRCFWLERNDHTTTDWGVPSCLIGVGRLNRQALRAAVRVQIHEFKEHALASCVTTFISEYSGNEFPISEAVVDHVIEFETIVREFCDVENIDIECELLTTSVDQKSEPVWRDPDLMNRFLVHHNKFRLRIVQWRENLSDIKLSSNK